MSTKPFIGLLALGIALAMPAFAQEGKQVKSDAEKTKTKGDGMTVKTKVAEDDGKTKVKAKSTAGDKMKSKTKPEKVDMSTTQAPVSSEMPAPSQNEMASRPSGVMVGGALMTPSNDIVDNAVMSSEHTTLVAAVKAAGLAETLKGTGPFTVFAPTNAAFDKLPAGTVNKLVQPDMKPTLSKILTYHVVPGRLTASDLRRNGQTLTTVQGEKLTVGLTKGDRVMLKDAKGNVATITIPDVVSSNGITHVVDAVLMPAK
ncbi:hypothetical protein GCM10023185_31560 [Hymenobacter saemangeumensis]|uniref:FAS1 domain-containing protein n=1 Tax=Hymenobacter saemangeumensis TaxID=1084522 RepID=A0ABP8IMT6_9BACT